MDFQKVIDSPIPTVVDVGAEWCSPCKMMDPIVDEIKDEYGNQINIVKIDVNKDGDLANQLGVLSIPTFLFYKNGEVKQRFTGAIAKNIFKQRINEFITGAL